MTIRDFGYMLFPSLAKHRDMLVALCHASNDNCKAADKRIAELEAELHKALNDLQGLVLENNRLKNEKPKIMMQMDYETSQVAALDEFKET